MAHTGVCVLIFGVSSRAFVTPQPCRSPLCDPSMQVSHMFALHLHKCDSLAPAQGALRRETSASASPPRPAPAANHGRRRIPSAYPASGPRCLLQLVPAGVGTGCPTPSRMRKGRRTAAAKPPRVGA